MKYEAINFRFSCFAAVMSTCSHTRTVVRECF